ncbi:hypothetical protein QBC45DRAFT_97251 [Copromyces sp. CBS 386.78]|nr:hypothetical protein QBC45DRAFT_97251 [Copromyces sp. CBS 386.78]
MLLTDTPRNPPLDRDSAHPTLNRVKQLETCPSPQLAGHSSPSSGDITSSPFQRISAPYIATAAAICFHGGQGTSRPPVGQVLSVTTSTAPFGFGWETAIVTDPAQAPYKAARGTVALFPASTSSRSIRPGVTCWLKFGCLDTVSPAFQPVLAAGKSGTVEPVLTQHSGAHPGTRGTKAASSR